MFFQNKAEQKPSEDTLGMEPLNNPQSGLAAKDKSGDEDQVPRFYQKEDLYTRGAQSMASVSQNSFFRGDVETKDDITIFGRLEGNILGAASVRVCGEVKGQIRCEALQAVEGTIEGDIFAIGSVEVSERSRIRGNLHCERAVISGSVTGDIVAAQSITLTENAVLNGDLCAAEIEMRRGARLNGSVKTEQTAQQEALPQKSSGEEAASPEAEAEPEPIVL